MNKWLAFIALILVLGVVNWSIYQKEEHLANGKVVYLELAPVDPRSLMQGDYMALRFQIADKIVNALPERMEQNAFGRQADASDGYVLVTLSDQQIAHYKKLYKNETVAQNELLLRYRIRNSKVKFASNAFFFQEGHAKFYEPARYGQFRVNNKGELLLVALFDKALKRLGPAEQE
jgi:uncharacterized membrane-anchored protein